jgi:hypothetical protein
MRAALVLALMVAALPALAQQDPGRPAVGPPPIHPNDLNAGNARERSDEIRRSGNPSDYGQMNSLDSLRLQSDNMNAGPGSNLAPIPPERAAPTPPRPVGRPQPWPGYQPGYLPRQ